MTGEITLRGRVLPIGGLKEKTLAAHRAGMKTVLIPRENRKDLREIPKRIREQLRIVPVEYVDDVLREALLLEKPDEFFRKAVAAEVEPPPVGPLRSGLRREGSPSAIGWRPALRRSAVLPTRRIRPARAWYRRAHDRSPTAMTSTSIWRAR